MTSELDPQKARLCTAFTRRMAALAVRAFAVCVRNCDVLQFHNSLSPDTPAIVVIYSVETAHFSMESEGIPSEYWRDDSALERWESLASYTDAKGHSMGANTKNGAFDTSPMGKVYDDGDPLGNEAPGLKTRQRPEEKSGDGVSGRTRRGRKLVPMTKKDVGHLVEGAAFAPKPPPGKKYAAAGLAAPPPGQRPSSRAQIMKRERCSQEVELDSSHRCTKPSKSGNLSQNVRAPESTGEQLGQLTSNTTSNSRFKARTPSPGLTPPPEEPEEDAVLSCFSDRAKSLMCSTMEKKGAWQQTAKLNRNHRFKARTPSPGLTPPPEEPEEDAVLACFSDREKSLMCSTMEKKGAWQQTAKLNRNHRLKARSPSPPEEPEEDTALTCRGDSHRTLMRCTPRRKGPQRPTGNTAQVRFKARTPSPCLPPPPEQPEEDVTVTLTFRGDSKSSRTRSTVEKKGVQQTVKRRHKKQEFGPTHSGFDDKLDSDKKVATEREVVFRPKTARGRRVLKDSTSDSKQRSSSDTKGPTQLLVVHPDEEPADKANRFKARTPSPCLSPPPEYLTQEESVDNGLLTCLGDTKPSLKLFADGRKLVQMAKKGAGNLVEGAGFTPNPPRRKKCAAADVTSPPPGQRPSSRAQIMKRERCKQQTEVNSSHRLTKWSKSENLSQSVRVEEPKCEQARQKNHWLLPPINACADAAGISLRGKHASDDMRRTRGDNRLNRVRLPPISKKS
ncbi:La- protein 6 [Branchiostoma belcheri]|nr:La- protein 6 [Branchiostoma belcheri]